MQATRNFVSVATEFAASVQNCQHNFKRTLAFVWTRRIWINRNATTVVLHLTRTVFMQGDCDAGAEPRHRLVNRVVDDLPNEVM